MLTNKQSILKLLSAMLIANLVFALLFNSLILERIEGYINEQYDDYLLETKQIIITHFTENNTENWQSNAIRLAKQFDASCLILARTTHNFAPETLAVFSSEQALSGYIDRNNGIVYLPLNNDFVVELGPLPLSPHLALIADWSYWLSIVGFNMLILGGYLYLLQRKQLQLTQLLAELPAIEMNSNLDVEQYIEQIKNQLIVIEQQNSQRITLQRDLLHGVAHEFRSPMARMQFALDMLEECPKRERDELMANIHHALTDLGELVSELLYYAKLKDINLSLKLTPIELSEMVKQAIVQVAPFYPNTQFIVDTSSTACSSMLMDEKLIARMLNNLLRNAGRFAKSLCHVKFFQVENHLVIKIADDGVGVPPGKAERIFEPFTRLDHSRSRDSGGCGLGLAIVASIVSCHNGEIKVSESSLGGAEFSMLLPLISESDV